MTADISTYINGTACQKAATLLYLIRDYILSLIRFDGETAITVDS